MATGGPFNRPSQGIKRTRSQLPDLKFDFALDRSPLKEARASRKLNHRSALSLQQHGDDDGGDGIGGGGTEDSMDVESSGGANEHDQGDASEGQPLLARKKRPSSPPVDQENVKKPRHSSSSRSSSPSHDDRSPAHVEAEADHVHCGAGDAYTAHDPGPSTFNRSKSKSDIFGRPASGTPKIDLNKLPPSPYLSPARTPKLQFRPVPSGLARVVTSTASPSGLAAHKVKTDDSSACPVPLPKSSLFADLDANDDTITHAPAMVVNDPTPTNTPQPTTTKPRPTTNTASRSMPPPAAPSLTNWLKKPGQTSLVTPHNQTGFLRAPGLAQRAAAAIAIASEKFDASTSNNATSTAAPFVYIPATPLSPLTPLPPTPWTFRPPPALRKSPGPGVSRLPRPPSAPPSPVKKPAPPASTTNPNSTSTSNSTSNPKSTSSTASTSNNTTGEPKKATRQLTLAQTFGRPKGVTKRTSPSPSTTTTTTSAASVAPGGAKSGNITRLTRSASLKQREKVTQAVDVAKTKPAWGSPTKPASSAAALGGPSSPMKSATRPRSQSTAPSFTSTSSTRLSIFGTSTGSSSKNPTSEGPPRPGSSLANLSLALQKLAAPPPLRPNTSIGFHRDGSAPAPSTSAAMKVGAGAETSRKPVSMASTSSAAGKLKRSNTTSNAGLGLGAAPSSGNGTRPLSRTASGTSIKAPNADIKGKGKAPMHNVMRNPVWQRPLVSQKTSLSTIPASPMKGGEASSSAAPRSRASSPMNGDTVPEMGDPQQRSESVGEPLNMTQLAVKAEPLDLKDITPDQQDSATPQNQPSAALRTSAALRALSHSISSLPDKTPRMRTLPPAKPRSTSATYITRSMSVIDGADPGPGPSNANANSTSSGAANPSGNNAAHISKSQKPKTLKVLSKCSIFVDVRTDQGDDASSLFVDMLKGLGARILSKLSNACTHVVYKNGLQSTLTRYRLIREPRPHVVGIAWVVECVEQMERVDESRFNVEIAEENIAGVRKHRRKSMIPKQAISYLPEGLDDEYDDDDENLDAPLPEQYEELSSFDTGADASMDISSSSVLGDETDLPPLEKARRRRLGLGSSG